MKTILALLGIPLLVCACASGPRTTVRVDAAHGAPRLVVDGQPVRARMFFGLPASAPIKIEPVGRTLEFEFTASADALGHGTLHFRFGQMPGAVFLDNIRIVDVATGKDVTPVSAFEGGPDSFARAWGFYPIGAANTVGTVQVAPATGADGTAGLHINLRQPVNGEWPDWHIYHLPDLTLVRSNRYRVSFWARAEPARDLTVSFYRLGNPCVPLGGPPGLFESQIKMAAAAGVDFVSFVAPMPWPAPGAPADWSATDSACEEVLRANPKALLLPRIGVSPPDWWRKAHPDAVMTWEDGSRKVHAVVASPEYRRAAAARVAALVEHLENKFGDRMAGYHPCGQNTGEWFYEDTWGHLLNGYAPADTTAWRAWLQKRYRNDAALQTAWHDPAATLHTAAVPTPAQRRATPTGTLRDGATQKALIDFAAFQQDAMADLICDLARAVRQASHGRKLVVFFYGYLFEFASVRLGPATSGHYALRRVLDCPDIDVLCAPISYFDRGLGGGAPTMTAAESVALAGKMWLSEDDTRTHLALDRDAAMYGGAKNIAEAQTILRRNVAQEATRNFATWWMDLPASGWFNDPRLWDEMRRLEPVDRVFLDNRIPYRPEVAAIIDERAMREASASIWNVTETGVSAARRPLARMGAPYGQYLLDDVVRGRVQAKLYVFLNAWQLSAAQRKALRKKTRDACNVWCYAPGLHDGDRTAPEAMRELTGFRLVPVSPTKAWATPTDLGRQRGLQTPLGVDRAITPLFAAADATPTETLATYPDGSAAIALRQTADGWSMFVGVPGLTSDLLRIAARKGAARLYTQTDCNVYANGPIIALHAAQDGAITLDTGHRGAVHDALTGAFVGNGPTLTLPMTNGDTRVLRLLDQKH